MTVLNGKKKNRFSFERARFAMGLLTFDKPKYELPEFVPIARHTEQRLLGKIVKRKVRKIGERRAPDGYFGCPEIKSKKYWRSARSCYAGKSGQLIMKRAI